MKHSIYRIFLLCLMAFVILTTSCYDDHKKAAKQKVENLNKGVKKTVDKLKDLDFNFDFDFKFNMDWINNIINFNYLSKEEYLLVYRQFIKDMHKNYANYDYDDWLKADKTLHLYSHNYYRYFKQEMTLKEKLELNKYPILYHLSKYKSIISHEVEVHYEYDTYILQKSLNDILHSTHPEDFFK